MTYRRTETTFWLVDFNGDNIGLFRTPEEAKDFLSGTVDPEDWEESSCGWVALDYYGIEEVKVYDRLPWD